MDPNDELDFLDSGFGGMSSLASSKDDSPENKVDVAREEEPTNQAVVYKRDTHTQRGAQSEDEYDDEPDETLGERLWGLTEMFPEGIRNTTHSVTSNTWELFKVLYSFTRGATWLVASSSVILFAPVIFEVERAQMEEMQRTQQKQVLFGPPAGGMTTMPPLQR